MLRILTVATLAGVAVCGCAPEEQGRADEAILGLMDVWRTGEVARLDSLLSDAVTYDDVPNSTQLVGREEVAGYVGHVHSWATDVRLEVLHMNASASSASAEWVMTGVQDRPIAGRVPVATDRPFELRGVTVIELDDEGRIRRASDHIDVLPLVLQLGGTVELPGGVVLGGG